METEQIKHKKQDMIGLPVWLKQKLDAQMIREGYKVRSKYIEHLLNKQ